MRKIFLAMLMACLLIIPARAEDTVDQTGGGMTNEREDRVVVTTLDELKAAIAAANDGDIIELAQTIQIVDESISTDKDITVVCAENFEGQIMFDVRRSTVTGLSFNGSEVERIFTVIGFCQQETIIQNCTFDGGSMAEAIAIFATEESFVRLIDCEIKNCFGGAVSARASTNVILDRCYIHETYATDVAGAVESSGKVTLNDCIITGNSSFADAGVLCSGTLIISGGQIRDNTISSPKNGDAVDVFCSGTWSITDEPTEDAGYYDTVTGEKLSLPVYESNVLTRLVYLKDDDAKEYFSFLFESDTSKGDENNTPEQPQEPTQTPEGDGEGNQPETTPQEPISPPTSSEGDDASELTPEQPKDPVDSDGEKDEGDSTDKQPETSDQPSQGEDENNSDNNPPQTPEQPVDPPQDDNVIAATPDAPQRPQEPIDSNTSYIPYWPSVRPTRPTVTTTTPTDEPQIEPETPARKRQLICNGAAIDTSKMIVLLGYGDGQLHEADSLTRAQLATVIFRLLDDDTVVRYGGAGVMFTDVAADAWYAPYVNVIGRAGIVNGVGNGMYDPDGTVTWAQIITILTRFVEPQNCELRYIQYSGWALESIQTAVALEWIEDSFAFNPDAIISRGELVNLINAVLEQYQ